ncbi:MAG: hypothetical protein CMJ46_11530 [Planctomyces sp.]|nr:hypothetical protein [Planctomyces sp.]
MCEGITRSQKKRWAHITLSHNGFVFRSAVAKRKVPREHILSARVYKCDDNWHLNIKISEVVSPENGSNISMKIQSEVLAKRIAAFIDSLRWPETA